MSCGLLCYNLIYLFYLFSKDVHETAAGALWNLAFNPGNALRIVAEGGVTALVHLCSSSVSKMARFMAALALAYMFDGRYSKASYPHSRLHFSLLVPKPYLIYTGWMNMR